MNTDTATDSLATFVRLPDYQGQREHLFGSFASIRMVCPHTPRPPGQGRGASNVARQWFVAPDVFDEAIREIGSGQCDQPQPAAGNITDHREHI